MIANVIISGYTQGEDEANGCEILYQRLLSLTSPKCALFQKEWNDDMGLLAGRISRLSPAISVNIFPYSWGCGKACVDLARALGAHGRVVDNVVAADPVYHSWFPSRIVQWTFALSGKPIALPANVRRAESFIQKSNYPRGSAFSAENPSLTEIVPPVLLAGMKHADMEDSILWHNACFAAASRSLSVA